MAILYDKKFEEPPPADRLRAMINALASGAEINAPMRAELIDALKRHEVRLRNDELRSKRGRVIEMSAWFAATIAKQLLDKHGAKTVQAAIFAAVESVRWQMGLDPDGSTIQQRNVITRNYQKLNKSDDGYIATTDGGKFKVVSISSTWMDYAIARLNRGETSGLSPAEATGVIAQLTDPIQEKTY